MSFDFEGFNFVAVASGDPEMDAAIQSAGDSLPSFFEAFEAPGPNQKNFLLKVRFERDGNNEHIWLADLQLQGNPFMGVIANEPRLPGLTFMERVTFSIAEVTDWMYMEHNSPVGGYTSKLLFSRVKQRLPWWRRLLLRMRGL